MNSFNNCNNGNVGYSGGGCDCLIWILILLICCGGCGGNRHSDCGCSCILPIIVLLCCCGGCGGSGYKC